MHLNKIQFSYDLSGMTARDVTHQVLLGMWLELQIQLEELGERGRSWILMVKNSNSCFSSKNEAHAHLLSKGFLITISLGGVKFSHTCKLCMQSSWLADTCSCSWERSYMRWTCNRHSFLLHRALIRGKVCHNCDGLTLAGHQVPTKPLDHSTS